MHELRHTDKHRALAEAMRVLKPGGRLVIGDMMFSFNPMQARDRHVVSVKLRTLVRRGPPGVLRLLKNAARLASASGEHPANAAWWQEALGRSGFHHVRIEVLAHEGGIAMAEKMASPAHGSASIDAVPGTLPSEASRASASDPCLR
jgi:ubiquinone/menaquinone biosynthesis C-methylase UbiE